MMFSKMTISKRIICGYAVFIIIFMVVVVGTVVQNIIAINNANKLDMYNKADIISNNALDLYKGARTNARDIYLTKTYSDETYNALISNLDESINKLNNDFMNVAKSFITSKHKSIVDNIITNISEYKKVMETIYAIDREKIKLDNELTTLGVHLLEFFNIASTTINDIVTRQSNEVLRSGNTVLSVHEFHKITDTFWKARVTVRNILFLDDISEYDTIKSHFRGIETALIPYEEALRNSQELDYNIFLSDLQKYEQLVDQYKDLSVQSLNCNDRVMVLVAQNNEYTAQASEITLANLNNSVSSIITGSISSLSATAVISVIGIVIAIVLATIIGNSISKVLKKTVHELAEATSSIAGASNELTGASGKLAQGNSEQASSLEETAAAMTEASSMISQNTKNTYQAVNLSKVTEESSLDAVHQVEDLIGFMEKLSNSATEINKIISTIDLIATQTTILALNASVEAVRAGEAGKSFSVVAEEVRNLAQRSTKAAESTTNIIKENIMLSQEGAAKSHSVGESLKSIMEDAKKTTHLLSEISTASEEQSQGANQINAALSQMEKVSQSTASVAEESAASAQELNGQANVLYSITERVKKLVGTQ